MVPPKFMAAPARIKPEPMDENRILRYASPRKPIIVKPEPGLSPSGPLLTYQRVQKQRVSSNQANGAIVKAEKVEPDDGRIERFLAPVPPFEPRMYTKYASDMEIDYTPENALKVGYEMVKFVKERIRNLEIGSKLRKEVWKKELEELSPQSSPTTLIAICGATGAGKSSVINAVLDDTIVPTSGMRACTAVVTEISYKKGHSIEGDVAFLTVQEWKNELEVLLDDLVDENGNPRRVGDMKSESGIAWSKLHAVYPNIPQDDLVNLNADIIIARDPKIAAMLGTTKRITAANSRDFGKAIAPFIDSKEKKRGKKDEKAKKKDEKAEGPALWPLIKTVKIRCPAGALSTGAVLVDLPGTADANAARSSIAAGYMQRCHCIWILAPITRAVDDKVAKDLLGQAFKTQLLMDGNYDTSTVTFVATKTDDISCNEIINSLHLEDDEDLQEIENKIEELRERQSEEKKKKTQAKQEQETVGAALKDIRSKLLDTKERLRDLEAAERAGRSSPIKTPSKSRGDNVKAGKKRKSSGGSPKAKRRKGSVSDDEVSDNFIVDDSDSDSDSDDSQSSASDNGKGDYKDSDEEMSEKDDDGDESDDESVAEIEAPADTAESLKEKIKKLNQEYKDVKEDLAKLKDEARAADKEINKLKDKLVDAQRSKNGLCAKARNEYSRLALMEDWRSGVREMDQEAAMQENPDTFDPTFEKRNYDEIDLPTFTVSSRDYIRLTKQVQGDGEPTCFTSKDDTQIPMLRDWCKSLTVSSRERAARSFMKQLKTFTLSVQSYLHEMSSDTEAERAALRLRWATTPEGVPAVGGAAEPELREVPYNFNFNDPYGYDDSDSEGGTPAASKAPSNPRGVGNVLQEHFLELVGEVVTSLQNIFRASLEDKLKAGSTKAASVAVETSETFAESMHWGTYRATLRRNGAFRRDFNAELCLPMTGCIAQSWAGVFEQDLFKDFEQEALKIVQTIISEIKKSAAQPLKERCEIQGELAVEDAKDTMKKITDVVTAALQKEQKEISRCLAPNVQTQLNDGYYLAMQERGTGSVKRQKNVMHDFVKTSRNTLFSGASQVLMTKLAEAAAAVGLALQGSLVDLSRKVEVAMSVLWETAKSSPKQVAYRNETLAQMVELTEQVHFWITAEQARPPQIAA